MENRIAERCFQINVAAGLSAITAPTAELSPTMILGITTGQAIHMPTTGTGRTQNLGGEVDPSEILSEE